MMNITCTLQQYVKWINCYIETMASKNKLYMNNRFPVSVI